MPRQPAKAPRGRLTLQQAADLSGLSKPRVWTLVTSGEIPGEQGEDGVWTIARADAAKIKHREPADTDRKAIQLRPNLERYAAWERAARHRPVSVWLSELADAAAGWREKG